MLGLEGERVLVLEVVMGGEGVGIEAVQLRGRRRLAGVYTAL